MMSIEEATDRSFLLDTEPTTVRTNTRLEVIREGRPRKLQRMIEKFHKGESVRKSRLKAAAIQQARETRNKIGHALISQCPVGPTSESTAAAVAFLNRIEEVLAKQVPESIELEKLPEDVKAAIA